jgi:excinuclease UvrABC nuclease subunit
MSSTFIGNEFMEDIQHASEPFTVDGRTIGLPFNLEQAVTKFGYEIIPDELGIYHLFYENQLVYIGMSKRMRGRLKTHLKDKNMPFNNVLWFCASEMSGDVTVEDIMRIEHKMIKKFMPALNLEHANCR